MRWIALIFLLLIASPALAQSSPGWPAGFFPSAQQWLAQWSSKRDYNAAATSYYVAGSQVPSAAFAGATYYYAAAGSFTLPSSKFVPPDRGYTVNALGGAVTILLGDSSDKLQNGSPGVGTTLAQGVWAVFTTDGAGNWRYSAANISGGGTFPGSVTITGILTFHTLAPTILSVAWNSSAPSGKTESIPGCTSNNLGEIHIVADEAGTAFLYPITIQPLSGNIQQASNIKISQPFGALAFHCDGLGNWVIDSATIGSGIVTNVPIVVTSNAALQAVPVSNVAVGTFALRAAFYPGVASGPTTYAFSGSNCSSADNGAQVQPNSGTGCWIAQFPSSVSPLQWGASGSNLTTACSVNGPSLSCAGGVADFVSGENIAVTLAGNPASASTPTLGLTAVGGSGTLWWYSVAAIDANMGISAASTAASVSGAPVLGSPNDMSMKITGNAHSNTTIDNLKTGGVTCTYATCPIGVGGVISASDLPFGTTISAINSPTSIVVSNPASNSNSGVLFTTQSPGGGVYNALTISGTASAYAIYEGTASNNLTCIGVMDGNAALNSGIWNDYGGTGIVGEHQTCPAWVPLTPPSLPVNQTFRTVIQSISGNVIRTAATPPAAPSNATVYHDDTNALDASLDWGGPLAFGCNIYNIFGAETVMMQSAIDGSGCGTIAGIGVGFDDLTYGSGSSGAILQNIVFDDTNKASNFSLVGNASPAHVVWRSIIYKNPYNLIELIGMNNNRIEDVGPLKAIYSQLRGDVCIYMTGTASMTAPYIIDTLCGKIWNGYGILVDGNVNSEVMENVTTFPARKGGLVIQNTIGGSAGNFLLARNLAINTQMAVGISINTGTGDTTFNHLYMQGQPGNGADCIYIGPNSNRTITIDAGSIVTNCDQHLIEDAGAGPLVVTTTAFSFGNQANTTYDKIHIDNTAGTVNLNPTPGDNFTSNLNNATQEACGIHFVSGYGNGSSGPNLTVGSPFAIVTTAAPGTVAPVCDSSGAAYGVVKVDGQFNSPTWSTSASGITLTGAEMVSPDPLHLPAHFYRSGPTSTFTDTTRTAAQLVNTDLAAQIPAVVAGQTFTMEYWNLTSKTATLAGGTGVTPATCGTIAGGAQHIFGFTVTNVGSPAVTCALLQ